jgi:hypothetical protein
MVNFEEKIFARRWTQMDADAEFLAFISALICVIRGQLQIQLRLAALPLLAFALKLPVPSGGANRLTLSEIAPSAPLSAFRFCFIRLTLSKIAPSPLNTRFRVLTRMTFSQRRRWRA